jgi:NitT/TauT family transport system substrate-binding protein
MYRHTTHLVLFLLLLSALALSACGGEPAPAPTTAPTAAGGAAESPLATPATAGSDTLRIALIPVLDVLPFHVAVQNGYFEEAGVQVEGVPVKSAQERDTVMQTGQVDGMLTDLISPIIFNQDEAQIKTVYTARKVYPDAPMFRLLAAPGSAVSAPADLAGVPIGSARNTVIAYLTDRMLQAAGLEPDQIVHEEVAAIPVRFELLINGELAAGTLPDPLASGAIAAGAVPIIDDTTVPKQSQSILAFSVDALENKPDAVRRFLQAWERAAQELNDNPDAYRDLLIREGRVPESVQGTFQMPPYPIGEVPSPEQLADVVAWALENGLIDEEVPYDRMVDTSFLP